MSETKKIAPYGIWQSPISSQSVGSGNHVFELKLDSDDVFFVEVCPTEERARYSLTRISAIGGETFEITPRPYNVRSTVHEYGGGAFVLSDEAVYFSNFSDQRLYKHTGRKTNHLSSVIPLTRESIDTRYADGVFDKRRNRIICIREYHSVLGKRDATNSIVAIDLDGTADLGGSSGKW